MPSFLRHTLFTLLLSIAWCASSGQAAVAFKSVAVASTTKVRGIVADSATNSPIYAATITVIAENGERMAVKGCATDKRGEFVFDYPFGQRIRIEVSQIGYKLAKIAVAPPGFIEDEVNVGRIRLAPDIYQIDAIVVRSRIAFYRMKGDTIVYIPAAVKSMEGDVLADLLKRMPGVEVGSDGSVKVMGKSVERTYVNGELFYGSDPTGAVKSIDAKDVAEIMAYDEVDEVSEIAYGKDARKRKVLDVITFERFRSLVSGRISGQVGADGHESADGGRETRYSALAAIAYHDPKKHLDIFANAENALGNDLIIPGRRDGKGAYLNAELTPNKISNYSVRYYYNNYSSSNRECSEQEYFPTTAFTSQYSSDTTISRSRTATHSISLGGRHTVEEKYSIHFGIDSRFEKNDSRSAFRSRTLQDDIEITNIDRGSTTQGYNRMIDGVGGFSYRIADRHAIEVHADASYSAASNAGRRVDDVYTSGDGRKELLSTSSDTPCTGASASFGYGFNTKNSGSFSVSLRSTYNKAKVDKLALNQFNQIDEALSGNYQTDEFNTTGTLSYGYNRGKHDFRIHPEYQVSLVAHDESFPATDHTRKRYGALLPIMSYTYRHSPSLEMTFRLRSQAFAPKASMLNNRIDDKNPMMVTSGNPGLGMSKSYGASLSLRTMPLSVDLSATLYRDPVAMSRTFYETPTVLADHNNYEMPAGSTLVTPVNADPYINISPSVSSKVNLAFIRSVAEFSAGYSYTNRQEGVGDRLVRTYTNIESAGVNITTNFSSRFRLNAGDKVQYTSFENYLGYTDNALTQTLEADCRWDFSSSTFYTMSYAWEVYRGSEGFGNFDSHVLNASLGCRIFKNRKGILTLNAYDILNRSANIVTTANNQYISTLWQQMFSSYFTVGFEYKFDARRK